jgi:glycosyltransferase involved in cell wall biosynthesis
MSLISLITPSYNQGQYLEQTILSVLSHQDVEYIVIDGASSDNSVSIIKQFETKLSFSESKPDKGQSDAINKGIARATGDIFNWLCSDDYLENNALNIVKNAFQDKDVRIVSGSFITLNVDDGSLIPSRPGIRLDETAEKSFARVAMTQPVTFWRMDDVRMFGGINERLHYFMDLEMVLKYLLHYGQNGILEINEILATYRVHQSSKTALEMDNTKMLPDSAFNIEKNTIFYYLSKRYGLPLKMQKAIKGLMNTVDESYKMSPLPNNPMLDVPKAIYYYVYDFLRRYYYTGDIKKAYEIAWSIDIRKLDADEAKGLKYLRRQLLLWKCKSLFK